MTHFHQYEPHTTYPLACVRCGKPANNWRHQLPEDTEQISAHAEQISAHASGAFMNWFSGRFYSCGALRSNLKTARDSRVWQLQLILHWVGLWPHER